MKNLKKSQKGRILLLSIVCLVLYRVFLKNTPASMSQIEPAPIKVNINSQLKDQQPISRFSTKILRREPLLNELPASSSLQYIVQKEKALLYTKSQDWSSHEAELKKQMAGLSADELKNLGEDVLSLENSPDERQISIYLLTLAGAPARHVLSKISQSPIPTFESLEDPHSMGALQQQRERSLRASALEALDVLATQKPQEVYLDLQNILAHQNDDSLKFFAKISLVGISQGKPGKLSRWLSQNVNNVMAPSL
jgi:hypothetical protein